MDKLRNQLSLKLVDKQETSDYIVIASGMHRRRCLILHLILSILNMKKLQMTLKMSKIRKVLINKNAKDEEDTKFMSYKYPKIDQQQHEIDSISKQLEQLDNNNTEQAALTNPRLDSFASSIHENNLEIQQIETNVSQITIIHNLHSTMTKEQKDNELEDMDKEIRLTQRNLRIALLKKQATTNPWKT